MATLKNKTGLTAFLMLSIVLGLMSVTKYHNMYSSMHDLGIFLSRFHMISRGEWDQAFIGHIQPAMLLWAPLFKIFPGELATFITLFSQSALLALPIIGLYRYYCWLPTIAFALYFPVWYNALFDFHVDHLAVPLLFAFFFLEKQGKLNLAIVMAMLLAFTKEIFALQAGFCGLYLLLVRQRRVQGLFLTAYGILFYLLDTLYLQKYFGAQLATESGGWNAFNVGGSPYAWMGQNLREVFLFCITKPHLVLAEVITDKQRMLFIFYTLGALGFIPLLRPGVLLTTAPIFLASLLSSSHLHHSFNNHYSAGLIPPFIIAFSESIPKVKELWNKAKLKGLWLQPLLLAGLLFAHIMLSPSPIGRKFYQNSAWSYHYNVYIPNNRNNMIKSALELHIPSLANVVVTTQNTLSLNHLSQRKNIFVFPMGATTPGTSLGFDNFSMEKFIKVFKGEKVTIIPPEEIWSDYVVLDLKRPWFLGDKGCINWLKGNCDDNENFKEVFIKTVEQTKQKFQTVYENDSFLILKRRSL